MQMLILSMIYFGLPSSQGGPSGIDIRCFQPLDIGRCRGQFPKMYYNLVTRSCDCFIHGGCSRSENRLVNRFDNMQECVSSCAINPERQRNSISFKCRGIFGNSSDALRVVDVNRPAIQNNQSTTTFQSQSPQSNAGVPTQDVIQSTAGFPTQNVIKQQNLFDDTPPENFFNQPSPSIPSNKPVPEHRRPVVNTFRTPIFPVNTQKQESSQTSEEFKNRQVIPSTHFGPNGPEIGGIKIGQSVLSGLLGKSFDD